MRKGEVEIEINNKVGTISFFHPEGNSMPSSLLSDLENEVVKLGDDPTVNVIVLQSTGGKTFCAGANIKELATLSNEMNATEFFMGFARVMSAIKNCSKPIIVKVDGKTVGGGIGLISACDYVLASKKATLKLSELSIGIGPFVISDFVERKVGISALSELTLNPFEWKTAQWGKDKGLYYEVFETNEQLNEYTLYFSEKLATLDMKALKEVKSMLWSKHINIENTLYAKAQQSGKLVLEDFAQDRISSFINKD